MDETGTLFGARPVLETSFAYGRARRLVVAVVGVAITLPLAYVVAFALVNPPARGNLGPLLIVVLFMLTPSVFFLLRFGHYFRSFRVESDRLAVKTLWHRWSIEWADIARVVRRTRVGVFGERSYRVRVKLELADGSVDWISLFDSALPQCDQLYAQILRHTPHVRPKELEDHETLRRRSM